MACRNCGECIVVGMWFESLCYSGMNSINFETYSGVNYFITVFRASGVTTSERWVKAVYFYRWWCFLVAAAKP